MPTSDAAARYARAAVPRQLRHAPDARLLQRLNDLAYRLRVEDGLSYRAIAAVVNQHTNAGVTPRQVRRWLDRLGAPTRRTP